MSENKTMNEKTVIELRQSPYYLSMRAIAEIHGVSRTTVHNLLKEEGLEGRVVYKELEKMEFHVKYTPAELSSMFGCSLHKAETARKDVMGRYAASVANRQKRFMNAVFPNSTLNSIELRVPFTDFLDEVAKGAELSPHQISVLKNFYVEGKAITESDRSYKGVILNKVRTSYTAIWGVTRLQDKGVIATAN